jgi:hypothetical protein
MEVLEFLDRVFKRVPTGNISSAVFQHWPQAGKATEEAFGLLPIAGVDPDRLISAVMDINHYVGNVEHVVESRSIADPNYPPPDKVRFYQRVNIPLLGSIHHELVLVNGGEMHGFKVAYWYLLKEQTEALNVKLGFRSQYNVGAWFTKPGLVGYALSSAPRKEDVGFLKWVSLTKGADLAAEKVLRGNIEGMTRWSLRR